VGDAAEPAQVFVAVLPYSGLVFADVTWSQRSADWLASHVRLFEALGGVPAAATEVDARQVLTFDKVRHDPQAPERYGPTITYDLPGRNRPPADGDDPCARTAR
jgi:hypothetical protein